MFSAACKLELTDNSILWVFGRESIRDMDHPAPMTSGKLEKLGWISRPLRETITDTVEFCREAGFLEDADGDDTPCRFPPLLNKV